MADSQIIKIEKPPFDIYGTLLVLSFVCTGFAAFLLYDDLSTNWSYGKTDSKVAVTLTKPNEDPVKNPGIINVRDEDLKDWELIQKNAGVKSPTFPVSDYKWPEGYNPLENPVRGETDNLKELPKAVQDKLVPSNPEAADSAAAPAAETK